jgi:dihydroxyacetone kinase DhaKLM complex PTS-EIIA-like component DhaM
MNQHPNRQEKQRALTVYDLLNLPAEKRHLLNWMRRQSSFSLQMVMDFLDKSEAQTQALIEALQQEGLIQRVEQAESTAYYQVAITSQRRQRHASQMNDLLDSLIDDL